MFHHISIAAENPFRVAKVMAELAGGQFFEFPVTPGAYMVTFQDEYGSGIEVLPKDTAWTPGAVEAEAQARELSRFSATHAALSVAISQEAIEAIGAREGWLVRWCDRGPFRVMELWIENNFLLELLTGDMTADYINAMKPEAYASF
ncbi:MAG: hypothetical protein WA885_23320 [Phormidesmis sp.]